MAKRIFTTGAQNKIFVASLILMILVILYNLIIFAINPFETFISLFSLSMILSSFMIFVLGIFCLNLSLSITKKYKFGFNLFTFLGVLFYLILTTISYSFIVGYSITNLILLGVFNIFFMILSIYIGGLVEK